MNWGRQLGLAWWAIVLGVNAGCGDGGSGTSMGRGTVACQDWQDALCDYVADTCNVVSRSSCDTQYQGVECKSDTEATRCANALDGRSDCTGLPAGCDLSDIADPAPAVAACERFIDTVCDATLRCDPGVTRGECETELSAVVPCEDAVSVRASFEQCLTEMETLSCSAAEVPDACNDVILVQR